MSRKQVNELFDLLNFLEGGFINPVRGLAVVVVVTSSIYTIYIYIQYIYYIYSVYIFYI